jgi:hypothetical protein
MYNCIYWVINIGISTSLYIYIHSLITYVYIHMKLWEHVTWDWESHVFLVSTIHQWLITLEPVLWTCYIVLHVCLLVKNCHVMRWNIVHAMWWKHILLKQTYGTFRVWCFVWFWYVMFCYVVSCHVMVSYLMWRNVMQCNAMYRMT